VPNSHFDIKGDRVMITIRRIALVSSVTIALTALVATADAQSYGPGSGLMGPGMMMGPEMMGRGGFGRMCSPAAAGFAEWRLDRLERLIKPTDAQRIKFDEYKAASSKAAEIMRSACPTEVPATMPGRMEAMEKRMDAMLQSVKVVRPTLDAFYATLTEDQKKRLDSNSGPRRFWRWRE
jgi:LTXXQ motif family protein